MTLKSNAKFEEKLTCGLENDMRNMANFHQSTRKSQNYDFAGILLSKAENVWALNLQRSYVSWQWRMMQTLKWNWLVVSKSTWKIWWILTRALFWPKYIIFELMFELCLMAANIDVEFEGKMTCAFKNGRN